MPPTTVRSKPESSRNLLASEIVPLDFRHFAYVFHDAGGQPHSDYWFVGAPMTHHHKITRPSRVKFFEGSYAKSTEITYARVEDSVGVAKFVGAHLGSPEGVFEYVRPKRPAMSDLVAELDDETRALLFRVLRDAWKRDTQLMSSATRILNHPAYRLIIMFGWTMVPLIIKDLRREFNHWFRALRILTGYAPPMEAHQNMGRMHAAWLAWADENEELAKLPGTDG